jgi:hypothetical protein
MKHLLYVTTIAALTAIAAPAAADDAAPAPPTTTTTTTTSGDRVARVGIVIGFTLNVDPTAAEAIGGALAEALVAELEVDAIGGVEVTRRLPATGLPEECVSTPACITDLGTRLTADQILFLAVVKVNDGFQVDATFVDVASGVQAARPRVKLGSAKEAGEKFRPQAVRYLPDAKVRAKGTTNQTVIVKEGAGHRPIKPVVWAVGGVGAGALIAGAIVGFSAKSKYDGCNGDRICSDDEKDTIKTRALVADIAMGVGVAAVVTAVVLYVRTPMERPPVVTPSVTPLDGGAVFSLDGRF